MRFRWIIKLVFLLPLYLVAVPIYAETIHVRENLCRAVYFIHKDLTYDLAITEKTTLLTQQGIRIGQRSEQTYFPKTQSLKLLEAYVIQPDGKRIEVTSNNIFTRPSQATQDAPGFTNSLTTTVVFPQLQLGSRTVVRWELHQIKPDDFGINIIDSPDFLAHVDRDEIEIHLPVTVKLHLAKRGNYRVTDKVQNNERIIKAVLTNKKAEATEMQMVSSIDVSPMFIASTIPSWEWIGSVYWQKAKAKVVVTPAIAALAKKIVGTRTGYAAAQALYNWVVQNIHYVAVYLNQADGYVPHLAEEVLRNGYGDCKDHVVLLQALLQASGIKSMPVLVSWGEQYLKFPIPSNQFNHIIIYLPALHVFANPTDPFATFGILDTMLSGKFAVIASDNPQAVRLPENEKSQHGYELHSDLKIMADGTIVGSNQMQFSGRQAAKMRKIVNFSESTKQLADFILASTQEGGSGNLATSNPNDLFHPFVMKGIWKSPYAVSVGREIFFPVPAGIDPFYLQQLRQLITPGIRKYPIIVGASVLKWNYRITIPANYKVQRLPVDVHLKNPAGLYLSHYQVSGQIINVERKLEFDRNVYLAKTYPKLLDLLYKSLEDIRAVIVLAQNNQVGNELLDYL